MCTPLTAPIRTRRAPKEHDARRIMAGRESKLVAAKTEVIQHCALPQLSFCLPSLYRLITFTFEKAFSARTAGTTAGTLRRCLSLTWLLPGKDLAALPWRVQVQRDARIEDEMSSAAPAILYGGDLTRDVGGMR